MPPRALLRAFLAVILILTPLDSIALGDTGADRADESQSRRPSSDLNYDPTLGVPLLTAAIASVALPAEIYADPPACRWCGGQSPNRIDRFARGARWAEPCRAARLSYWTLGVASVVALGPLSHEQNGQEWLTNAGIVADSVAVAGVLTQVAKYTFRRERPAANPCHEGGLPERDQNLSFFSGHSAIAFALMASARETARLRGRSPNEWLWVGGISAAATGYLRVAGDRHHLIDVLAGASVGFLVGKYVPRHFHHRPRSAEPSARSDSRVREAPVRPALLGFVQPLARGNRLMILQVGKGPGRSLQIGLSF